MVKGIMINFLIYGQMNNENNYVYQSIHGKFRRLLILLSSSFSISLKFRLASRQISYFLIFPYKFCYLRTLSAIFRYNLAI